MFARNVSIHLKPAMLSEYNQTFQAEILPMLRMQQGFQGQISFCNPDSLDLTVISLWDTREHAELYANNAYGDALKLMARAIDRKPNVRSEEVIQWCFMPSLSASVAACA